jgi:hypothetical protein
VSRHIRRVLRECRKLRSKLKSFFKDYLPESLTSGIANAETRGCITTTLVAVGRHGREAGTALGAGISLRAGAVGGRFAVVGVEAVHVEGSKMDKC